jgi:hypothetical protein
MDESTPCPRCEHENPPGNRFCGRCAASLTSDNQLVPHREKTPATVVRAFPLRLGPTGKTLAVGLVALAAELGVLWLRRRAERAGRLPIPAAKIPNLRSPITSSAKAWKKCTSGCKKRTIRVISSRGGRPDHSALRGRPMYESRTSYGVSPP